MYIVRQRLEACPIGGRRKALRVRQQSAVFIHLQIIEGNILILVSLAPRTVRKPFNVDHHILPAELLHICRHKIGICLDLLLIHRRIIVVIAVPPHRRCQCKFILIHVFLLLF